MYDSQAVELINHIIKQIKRACMIIVITIKTGWVLISKMLLIIIEKIMTNIIPEDSLILKFWLWKF